jgi:hypothetical protein
MRKIWLGLVSLVILVTTTVALSACKKSTSPSAGYVGTYSATKTVAAVPAVSAEYNKNFGDIVTVPANAANIEELIKMGLAVKDESAATYTDKSGVTISAGSTISASRLKDATISASNIDKLVELGWVQKLTSTGQFYKEKMYSANFINGNGFEEFSLADNKKVNDLASVNNFLKDILYPNGAGITSIKLEFNNYLTITMATMDGGNMEPPHNYNWYVTSQENRGASGNIYDFTINDGEVFKLASLDGLGLSEGIIGNGGAFIRLQTSDGNPVTVTGSAVDIGVRALDITNFADLYMNNVQVYAYKSYVTLTSEKLAAFASVGLVNASSTGVSYRKYNQWGEVFTLTEGYKIDIAVSESNAENLVALGLLQKTKDAVAAVSAFTQTINFAFNKNNTATLTITGKEAIAKQFVYTYVDKDSTTLPTYYFGDSEGYYAAELVAEKIYFTYGGTDFVLTKSDELASF